MYENYITTIIMLSVHVMDQDLLLDQQLAPMS